MSTPCGQRPGSSLPARPRGSTPIEHVITAEQALLGALLLQPDLTPAASRTVSPADFYRPAHAALFNALINDRPTDTEPLADRVLRLLATAGERAAGLTAVYAHTLMGACPHPDYAHTYARIVAEAAAARRIQEHAERLVQVAVTDRERGGIDETLRHLDTLHILLDRTRATHAAPQRAAPSARQSAPAAAQAGEPLMEEEMVLRALAADPAGLTDVSWLTPEDFAHPVHAALFACLRDLGRRGERIDPVTVLWEAHTAGHLADLRLDARRVTELLAGGTGVSAAYEAREVLRHALLRRTRQCAAQIADLAAAARLPAHHLAAAAARALTPAGAVRRRWHTAHAPASANTRPAAALPRGPTASSDQVPVAARPAARR